VFVGWDKIENRHTQLGNQLANHALQSNERQPLQREYTFLTSLLEKQKQVAQLMLAIEQAKQQAEEVSDAEFRELFLNEVDSLEQKLVTLQAELEQQMAPSEEHDDRSVYLEIRAGTGGQEAALFVADLMRMYTNYASFKGWRASVESISETDLGGYREVILHIEGKDAYGHLKRESGVHRVQRVPATETQGRVHTSTATVAVLPEAKEVDIKIDPSDLRIDVYRASGAGGQHVNTTDSAVRITHIPTNVVVSCQDERSQHKNKAKAMKILQSRILAAQMEQRAIEMAKQRKDLIGGGTRSEKVRTYNYPQNRLSDHQIELTLKKLDIIMEGPGLDEIIEALIENERENRKRQFLSQFS
jgi:peptide chain release factor 1